MSVKSKKTGSDDKMPGLREAILKALEDQLEKNWRNVMRPYGPVGVSRSRGGSALLISFKGVHFEVQVRQKS